MSNNNCQARHIRFPPLEEVRRMDLETFRRFINFIFERGSVHATDALSFLNRVEYSNNEDVNVLAESTPTLLNIFIRAYSYDGLVDFITSFRIILGTIPCEPRHLEVGFWHLYSSIRNATFMIFNIRAVLTPCPPPILPLHLGYGGNAICVRRHITYQQVLQKLVDKRIKYRRLVQYQLDLDEYYRRRSAATDRRRVAYLRRMEELTNLLDRVSFFSPRRRPQ